MKNDQDTGNSTILVADDEEYIVRVVAFKLRGAGYDVIEAVDGDHLTIEFDNAGTKRVMAQFVGKP